MFLHIGGEFEVAFLDIVAIFDFEKSDNKITKEFINCADKNGELIDISDDKCKSIIVVCGNKNKKVYMSPISTNALNRRYNFLNRVMQ